MSQTAAGGAPEARETPIHYRRVRPLILKLLPDFAWQSSMQVLTMLEQVDEDISYGSLTVTLYLLAREGLVEVRKGAENPIPRNGGRRFVSMYKAFDRPVSRRKERNNIAHNKLV